MKKENRNENYNRQNKIKRKSFTINLTSRTLTNRVGGEICEKSGKVERENQRDEKMKEENISKHIVSTYKIILYNLSYYTVYHICTECFMISMIAQLLVFM